MDLNIKFRKGRELLGFFVDQNQPFYLMSEKYPEVDEELKQFFDEKGRFQFRWFKEFLLKEITTRRISRNQFRPHNTEALVTRVGREEIPVSRNYYAKSPGKTIPAAQYRTPRDKGRARRESYKKKSLREESRENNPDT